MSAGLASRLSGLRCEGGLILVFSLGVSVGILSILYQSKSEKNGCHPLLWRAARRYTSDIKTAEEEEGVPSMLPQRPSPTERHDSRARAKTIYGAIAGKLDPSRKGKVL